MGPIKNIFFRLCKGSYPCFCKWDYLYEINFQDSGGKTGHSVLRDTLILGPIRLSVSNDISVIYKVILSFLIPDIRQVYFLALTSHFCTMQIRENTEIKS